MRQAPEHGEDAVDLPQRTTDRVWRNVSPGGGNAERSPDHFARQIAFSGVPLQLYWSRGDRIIADQVSETGKLAADIRNLNPAAKVWDFEGDWFHTAEMRPTRRLLPAAFTTRRMSRRS